jgi:hypothetical protein
VETAYRLRANAFLVKPANFDGLMPMLQSINDFWLTQNVAGTKFTERHVHA